MAATAITHTFRFSGAGEDFGPRADGMVTFHTWENGPTDNTVASMQGDLRWQDGDDVAGSYNRVVCVDGVISAVPDNHASGGINPGSAAWAPKAWLYKYLSREEVANPNYFTLNVCAAGQRAHYDQYGWPPSIIDGMARSWIDEERRIGRQVVPTNHADFQTNRTDAGSIAMALIKRRYTELTGRAPLDAQETDMQFRNPIVTQEWDTVPGPASTFTRPDGTTGYFTATERVKSIAEGTVNGVDSRLLDYGPNHEALVISRKGLTNPGPRIVGSPSATVVTKEVIKEVPTGITQAMVTAAVAKERERIAAAEADRIRAL